MKSWFMRHQIVENNEYGSAAMSSTHNRSLVVAHQSANGEIRVNLPELLFLSTWVFALLHLLVDTATGAILWQLGLQVPLSQAWKGLLVTVAIFYVCCTSARNSIALLGLCLLVLMPSMLRFIGQGDADELATTLVLAFKLILPVAMFSFISATSGTQSANSLFFANLTLTVCCFVLALNLFVGALGYGFTSYGTRDAAGLGVIGFFPAGNEVSATLLALAAYAMTKAWLKNLTVYLLACLGALAAAVLIVTKAAILGTLLLMLVIPVSYSTYSAGKVIRFGGLLLTAIIIGAILAFWQHWDYLDVSQLGDRLRYIYGRQGLLGVLLSGRDASVAALVDQASAFGLFDSIFGIGPTGLSAIDLKTTIEVDPLDVYLWFGLPGLALGAALFSQYFLVSVRGLACGASSIGPGVFAANVVLFGVSLVAGHVFFAGMAGIAISTLNGIALLEQQRDRV